jgi:hypothetical protein
MKKIMLLVAVIALIAIIAGCAGISNKIAQHGSVWGKTRGNYVVINYAGTEIADVWIIRDTFVDSPEGSDGWEFVDAQGNAQKIGGNSKITRVADTNLADLSKYHEYHMEFEKRSYRDLYIM